MEGEAGDSSSDLSMLDEECVQRARTTGVFVKVTRPAVQLHLQFFVEHGVVGFVFLLNLQPWQSVELQ